jgi:hypothetical protein
MIRPPENKALTRGEVKLPPCVPEETLVVIVAPAPVVSEVTTDEQPSNNE